MFTSHAWWDTEVVRHIVGLDAKVVTLLRDPVDLYEAGFKFYGKTGPNTTINDFAGLGC